MGITDWFWLIIIVGFAYWVWSGQAARTLIPGYALGSDTYDWFFGAHDGPGERTWLSYIGLREDYENLNSRIK